jgi:hypothetical protein
MTARRQTPKRILAVTDGSIRVGSITERAGVFYAYDATGALVGKFTTQTEAMRAIPPCRTRFEFAKAGSALLKRDHRDGVSGAKLDKQYRRNKRAESKRLGRHWRAKRKKLGSLGPASPVRPVEVKEEA